MKKHTVSIRNHKTSISLEPCFWDALKKEAEARKMRLSELVERFDAQRFKTQEPGGLSSTIRQGLFLGEIP